MKRFYLWLGLVALPFLLVVGACGPATVQPTGDQEAVVTEAALARQQDIDAAVEATLTAVAPPTAPPGPNAAATAADTPQPTPMPSPAAPATPIAPPISSPADVPRVTAQELKALLDADQAVLFDARQQEAFAEKHIVGAISLPQNQVVARLDELPADKLAVFYCT